MSLARQRMLLYAAALAALVVITGCAPAPARKLVGTWVVDPEQDFQGLPVTPAIKMVFETDGAYAISTGSSGLAITREGTWRFLEANDEQFSVEITLGKIVAGNLSITLLDDDRIQVSHPSLPFLTNLKFRRAT